MFLIRPTTIGAAQITSSSVPEIATGANPDPVAYDPTKVYVIDDEVSSTTTKHRYRSRIGKTSAVTMTIAAPCVVSWVAHNHAAGTPISFSTTGALPTGLTAGTVYYVVSPTTDAFNVAATVGGAAITTTGTQSGIHTAKASANYGVAVTDTTTWLDLGTTNKYAMFDDKVGSQTTCNTTLSVTLTPSEKFNSAAFIDVEGVSIRVQVGPYYDKTVMLNTRSVSNWYEFAFEPFNTKTAVVFTDMPPTGAYPLTITINAGAGNVAKCGVCKVGMAREIGGVEYGVGFGIRDFSLKTEDEFGTISVTERAYSRKLNVPLVVDNAFLDEFDRLLIAYRAKPIVWVASSKYSALIAYGYAKNFDTVIHYPDISKCQLTIEGLI